MKTVKIKSAMPIYLPCAVWILAGLTSRLYIPKNLIITLIVSAVVFFAAEKFWPRREVEVRDKADSGDREIDRQIEEGRGRLDSLAESNAAIPDAEITRNLNRMVSAGEGIFTALEKDTSRATQVRRFMNYYLPTADKLLTRYRELDAIETKGENVRTAMESVERSLEMIASAFEKQLDGLYHDESLDIQTDIDALEAVISAEGLRDNKNQMTMSAH